MKASLPLCCTELSLRAGGERSGRVLIQSLDVQVKSGERWVLLGPNGAGKTSLLSALAGLFPVSGGAITLGEQSLKRWDLKSLARERAWCPQFWSDPFPCSAQETVACAIFALKKQGVDADVMKMAHEWLDKFDAAPLANTDVRTLSGGERQRVALAGAFAQAAPLLLLDEPTAHLDWAHQILLKNRLNAWCEQGGSVIAAVHDLNFAWSLASHIVLLDGRGGAFCGVRDQMLTASLLGQVFGVPLQVHEQLDATGDWVRSFRVEMS